MNLGPSRVYDHDTVSKSNRMISPALRHSTSLKVPEIDAHFCNVTLPSARSSSSCETFATPLSWTSKTRYGSVRSGNANVPSCFDFLTPSLLCGFNATWRRDQPSVAGVWETMLTPEAGLPSGAKTFPDNAERQSVLAGPHAPANNCSGSLVRRFWRFPMTRFLRWRHPLLAYPPLVGSAPTQRAKPSAVTPVSSENSASPVEKPRRVNPTRVVSSAPSTFECDNLSQWNWTIC